MKILKINLTNIGPYIGIDNEFDFRTKHDKNIILIGGRNGAGKTTLLNSIKIGLFGSYAFGLKTDNDTYFKELIKLFNYVEAKHKKSNYAIGIEFSLIENYIENVYHFSRSWEKEEKNVTETFIVKKNNILLDKEETENIQTKIKEIMPPAVIDTMLFDGEKIAKIIDDGNISEYLKEIINVNFNINIFKKLDSDIENYIEKEKANNGLGKEEINLLELRNNYNQSKKNNKDIVTVIDKYNKSIDSKKFKLKNLQKKFENYDGLTNDAKEQLENKLAEIEKNRLENRALVKEFLEDDVVFFLNKQRILKIKDEIHAEKPILLLQYLNLIEDYLKDDSTRDIKKKLINASGNEKKELRYNASENLISQIDRIEEKINSYPSSKLNEILKASKIDYGNSKIYKKILEKNQNENSKDLNELLMEIKVLENEINETTNKLITLEKDRKKSENEMNAALTILENAEKKFNAEKKEENSFNIARNMLKVSNIYQKTQLNYYLKRIAELSVKKFDEINKKENYISSIIINNEDYSIQIYDDMGIEKSIQILSAGEKQLLISAIVWSVFKLSDRNNLFTFDTPLARLDKENRSLFVSNVLCTISEQVLILSTDEEIVGDLLSNSEKKISKKYLLENNAKTGKTTITEGYFNE